MFQKNLVRSLIVCTAIFAASGAVAQTQFKSGFNLFSADDDLTIGKESSAQAEQQLKLITDSQVLGYVNRIGQQLARNAGGPSQFQYTFHVVNDPNINAFALPGGWIYINKGVIENAKNEGEVAGVIAHEISHVSLRHGTQQASKAYLAQAGIDILAGVLSGRAGENTTQIVSAIGGFGLNTLFLKYSRDFESQADVRGAQILAASNYAPADMVSFFQTLEKTDTAKKTNFLSDHPAPPDRIARIQKEAQLLNVTASPTQNIAELRRIQGRLGGTTTTAGQGTLADILASVTGRTTTQPSLPQYATYRNRSGFYQISYPANWETYESGTKGVTIVAPTESGMASSATEITYGAVVNHYEPFDNEALGAVTLQAATQDLISTIRQKSPYLKLVSKKAQTLNVAGATGLQATLRGTDPNSGVLERVTVVTRQLPDEHLIYLLFVTPEKDASNYTKVLNQMVSSLTIDPSREP